MPWVQPWKKKVTLAAYGVGVGKEEWKTVDAERLALRQWFWGEGMEGCAEASCWEGEVVRCQVCLEVASLRQQAGCGW